MSSELFECDYLMCRPQYFTVSYKINPWMEPSSNPSNWKQADRQWRRLHHLLIRLGGYVNYIDPQPGLPDMVFTANHGLLSQNGSKFVIPFFSHDERAGEESHIRRWAEKDPRIKLTMQPSVAYEGAGDSLWYGDTLFCGHGIRSDIRAYHEIQEFFEIEDLVYCTLVDDYFYHLDTCFCPLVGGHAIFYPGAFNKESIGCMEKAISLHAVPENEAKRFACNSIVVDNNVIMPEGCPETEEILRSLDLEVYPTPMNEYIKAGGACKCCTLQLWRINGNTDSSSCTESTQC